VGTVSDLTVKILEKIHGELRGVNGRLDALTEKVDHLNVKIDQTNERLGHVIAMIGTHHSSLESRVERIEKHLGIT
jgi:hypothetical protein